MSWGERGSGLHLDLLRRGHSDLCTTLVSHRDDAPGLRREIDPRVEALPAIAAHDHRHPSLILHVGPATEAVARDLRGNSRGDDARVRTHVASAVPFV